MSAIQEAQSLLLRPTTGPGVAHLLLEVPPMRGRQALGLLGLQALSHGPDRPASLSLGLSFAGLERLALPKRYLRLFRRLSPAFGDGAQQRAARLGDVGDSEPSRWQPGFAGWEAHVLLSWHGDPAFVIGEAERFAARWHQSFPMASWRRIDGQRLGAPPGQTGEWVHFGFRDGISELRIDPTLPTYAPDTRDHPAGALLLASVNEAGYGCGLLPLAPDKVRAFFAASSFGILRPMGQDIVAFEAQVADWAKQLSSRLGLTITPDFVKAKLCGRWPSGQQVMPGSFAPAGSLLMNLTGDDLGEGCPFGSHVRRMRPAAGTAVHPRPLQRRSYPFGSPDWEGKQPVAMEERGLLGHFFCASIEDQFEHLLGQWAARMPMGLQPGAADPLLGPHEDAGAAFELPFKSPYATQRLFGFGRWARTLGTLYLWYPGRTGWQAMVNDDFIPDDDPNETGGWL